MGARALVVCVGNDLVADDGVGPAVHARLAEAPLPPGVRLELVAVSGLGLLDLFNGEDVLVVVDAVRFGAAPGTVQVRAWETLGLAPGAVTAHHLGVREAVALCRALYPERAPRRAVLVGVEGQCFDQFAPMTAVVAAALPAAVAAVRAEAERAGGR